MLEKIIQNLKSHPVMTATIGGAVAGYTVVSPAIMAISDKLHINPDYEGLVNHSFLESISETFRPEFLPWSLTYAVLTASIVGITSHFANRARVLAEMNHGIEKERLQIRQAIEKDAMEKKLNNYEEKLNHYKKLVDECHFGVYTSRLDGQLETANSAFANMLGYDTIDELLEVPVDKLYMYIPEKEEFIAELWQKKSVYDKTISLRGKDGQEVKVLCDAKMNGKIMGFIFASPEYKDNIISMCGKCRSIREGPPEEHNWKNPADYLKKHYGIETTHGLCLPCAEKILNE